MEHFRHFGTVFVIADRETGKAAQKQCLFKAKFHYTGPTGPARTRTDFFSRPVPQTRVSDKVRGLRLVGSGPVGPV